MEQDKAMHLIAGFYIGFFASIIHPIAGLLIGCSAGLAKEIRDKIVYDGFDSMDLFYSCLGALLGMLVHLGIELALLFA